MATPPPPPPGTQSDEDKIMKKILQLSKDQRKELLTKVKKQFTKKSQSSKKAAFAAEEFRLSRFWRLYCFFAASAGIMGQLSSLIGFFHGEALSYWFETDNHFVYQQITFVTSTLYIYNYYNLTTNRPSGSIPRILMCYPVVTFAYFTVFTGGQVFGLTYTEVRRRKTCKDEMGGRILIRLNERR